MAAASRCPWHAGLVILISLLFVAPTCQARLRSGSMIKSKAFLSPKIELEPGLVSNKIYLNLDFPKGHIAIKGFDAELVDELGNPVPLYETYLHHWVVARYHQEIKNQSNRISLNTSNGVCSTDIGFGSGSETRKTRNDIPGRYGIEVGNPAKVPKRYREEWLLIVHAIDTRGAADKVGCLECRCDLFNNITGPVPWNYSGGPRCCTDGARCKVNLKPSGNKRILYLKYTVKYVDSDASILPVRMYVLDVTDIWTKGDPSKGIKDTHNCQIEYNVEPCPGGKGDHGRCIDSQTIKVSFPDSGNVIYVVGPYMLEALQLLFMGREICTSDAIYGTSKEAGNEAGYVVGMTTCYPSPGSMKISAGEMVTLVANYSNARKHTGVMALFSLMLAD